MRAKAFIAAALAASLLSISAPARAGEDYGIGRPATSEEIAGWNIDVAPDGAGLPPGQGSVAQGAQIFADKCAACHGDHGQGKPMDALAGGAGTIATPKPVKTVGSYWPYATTLYDFIHRAMPFNAPQSLSPDEVYAVSAYVLFLNHLVPADAILDAKTLPKVAMPNRDAFVSAFTPAPGKAP
ncbi:c-type cytochrome [Methylocapsa sp. S129]|uniref:c-type cytochrome n=1 Tax=Methylocapsa sp. S129 TaxID=1641869 RepID=UPI00131B10AD|nr:cytochrome c [Methylocapsa sp. S129]